MEVYEATELLRTAVDTGGGVWADLGAGTGTFTQALARILDPASTIYAVDDDAGALRALREIAASSATRVVPVPADFAQPFEASELGNTALDGLLFANALHFVRDVEAVLSRLASSVRPGGRVVLVEYDGRRASRWVPYPISASEWPRLADAAGLIEAKITARRPSIYSGSLYVAVARKP